MNDEKIVLLGQSLDELKAVVKALGMPQFTAGQIAKWLYQQHVSSIDEMTNISKANREKLAEHYTVGAMEPIDCQRSKDGTVKYLFPVGSGQKFVETVYIPDHDRATLCVSCQVGCKMNCLFCQTGKQGFEGSLSAGDILNQIYSLPERDSLTNIVFMGQGEPMDNLDSGEQCGHQGQTEAVPRRERVPCGHLDALTATRTAPATDACRAADVDQRGGGTAQAV